MNPESTTHTYPAVSVVLPVRNEEATIGSAVASIIGQDYPGAIEIIVADGSDDRRRADDTIQALAGFSEVRIIPNEGKIVSTGLNRAIAESSHGIIARCDARSLFPPDYIRRAVETMLTTRASIVGGRQDPQGTGLFQRAVAGAMKSIIGAGNSTQKIGGTDGPTDMVYLGVFQRSALELVGGFNENLNQNQDYELAWRIRDNGGTVWFIPGLRVAYQPRSNIRGLAKQYFNYGRWKAVMLRHHPRSLRIRQIVAPMLVLGLSAWAMGFLANFANPGIPRWPWELALAPLMYPGALFAGSALSGIRNRDASSFLMPLAFATMHLSWGCGFIYSLLSLLPFRSGKPPDPTTSTRTTR